jgi:hypothetical protein
MKDTFVGIPMVRDHVYDRSIGPDTHAEIYNKFVGNEKWDYNKLCEQAKLNFEWLEKQYGTDLIKNEN